MKTLIRLGGCPGWSESLLDAQSLCWFCHVAAHICSVMMSQWQSISFSLIPLLRNMSILWSFSLVWGIPDKWDHQTWKVTFFYKRCKFLPSHINLPLMSIHITRYLLNHCKQANFHIEPIFTTSKRRALLMPSLPTSPTNTHPTPNNQGHLVFQSYCVESCLWFVITCAAKRLEIRWMEDLTQVVISYEIYETSL